VVLLGVVVLGTIAGAVALVRGGLGGGPASPGSEVAASGPIAGSSSVPTAVPTGTRFVSPDASGAPTRISLTDNETSVTLTWVDPSGDGTVLVAISVRTSDGTYLDPVKAEPGRTRARISRLDPDTNYCFVLTAIYSSDHLAPAAPVCTRR
jgi:hypothetical protein